MLEIMAVNGMNVARLNMCHGSHEWHSSVIERIRKLNKTKGCVLSFLNCAWELKAGLPHLSTQMLVI